MKTFRCFNLTDLETPELKQKGQISKPLVIGGLIVQPGQYVDVQDTSANRESATLAVSEGLLSVGSLPPSYTVLKVRLQQMKRLPTPPTTSFTPHPRVKYKASKKVK